MNLEFSDIKIDLFGSLPLLVIAVSGIFLLILDAFSKLRLVGRDHHKKMPAETSEAYVVSPAGSRTYLMPLSLLLLGTALSILIWQWFQLSPSEEIPAIPLYHDMLIVDRFGLVASGICIVLAMLSLATFPAFFDKRTEIGEAYPLVFFSLFGMLVLIMANDWVAMFVGIETLSLGVYVLAGLYRRSEKSSEASLKYFLSGAFISAILLYGIALIYGATGSTALSSSSSSMLFAIGAFLVFGSLAFKIAAVPFHMWAPDTYEGSPSPVTGLMMSAVKTAAFAFLIRFFIVVLAKEPLQSQIATGCYLIAALSMIIGHIGALRQTNVKRLLAYSSIAHVGYLLLGATQVLHHGTIEQIGVLLFYLFVYGITAIGTLAVVSYLGMGSNSQDELSDLANWEGLGKRNKGMAFAMTILLLSLAGFPPTAGFMAKFYLLRASMQETTLLWPLIAIALATTILGIAYYLRIIMAMYFRPSPVVETPGHRSIAGTCAAVVVAVTTILCLIAGILPNWFLKTAFSAIVGSVH